MRKGERREGKERGDEDSGKEERRGKKGETAQQRKSAEVEDTLFLEMVNMGYI